MLQVVRALLPSEGPAAGDEVFETLRLLQEVRPSDTTNPRPSLMEQDFGHTFPVMLLQLEVHAQDLIPKVDDYCAGRGRLSLRSPAAFNGPSTGKHHPVCPPEPFKS